MKKVVFLCILGPVARALSKDSLCLTFPGSRKKLHFPFTVTQIPHLRRSSARKMKASRATLSLPELELLRHFTRDLMKRFGTEKAASPDKPNVLAARCSIDSGGKIRIFSCRDLGF
jgi:hypothetical protein